MVSLLIKEQCDDLTLGDIALATKQIRLISWNVNGLRAAHRKGLLEWLGQEQPDVLCLQETKSSPEQLPTQLRQPPGYHTYFASAQRKGYSGVALYSKVVPVQTSTSFGASEYDDEGRVIIADLGFFTVCNVYFPNGKASAERLQYKLDFYEAFLCYLDRLNQKTPHIVVCGDVNTAHCEIDLARPRQNAKTSGFLPIERAWIDKLIAHGFIDTFRAFDQRPGQYTWWDLKTRARDRNVGWRIDYCFASEALMPRIVSSSILRDVVGSDHCPIVVNITTEEASIIQKQISR